MWVFTFSLLWDCQVIDCFVCVLTLILKIVFMVNLVCSFSFYLQQVLQHRIRSVSQELRPIPKENTPPKKKKSNISDRSNNKDIKSDVIQKWQSNYPLEESKVSPTVYLASSSAQLNLWSSTGEQVPLSLTLSWDGFTLQKTGITLFLDSINRANSWRQK